MFSPKYKTSNENIKQLYLFFRESFPFLSYKTNQFQEEINQKFNAWCESGEQEYILQYHSAVLIEPYESHAINKLNEVVPISLPYGLYFPVPFPHFIFYKKKKYIYLKKAVSISYNWMNYWHFFNDVIGQLYLLNKENFDKSIPILVPAKALKMGYVQYFLDTDFAKSFTWVFQQPDEYANIEEVYFCKSFPNIAAQFIFAKPVFQKGIQFVASKNRRIFLKRDAKRGRCLSNLNQLEPILLKHEFEIVDADFLTMEEQIVLFSEAAFICGIHGAGLTNMLFRHEKHCTVIEIFPMGFAPAHYYWQALELGFTYEAVMGDSLTNHQFELAPSLLEATLEKVFKN